VWGGGGGVVCGGGGGGGLFFCGGGVCLGGGVGGVGGGVGGLWVCCVVLFFLLGGGGIREGERKGEKRGPGRECLSFWDRERYLNIGVLKGRPPTGTRAEQEQKDTRKRSSKRGKEQAKEGGVRSAQKILPMSRTSDDPKKARRKKRCQPVKHKANGSLGHEKQ